MSKIKNAILDFIGDRFLKPVRVHSVEMVSEHFRVIHLQSELFRKETFRPGDKIQINTGDWNVRTYTPIALNSSTGILSILAFLHGHGPGSLWAKSAKAGDDCQVFGPRSSVSISDPEKVLLFGDETSFGIAAALKNHYGDAAEFRFLFEVKSISESEKIAERFGFLSTSRFVTRQLDDSHREKVVDQLNLASEMMPGHEMILTGNAKSIQFIRNQFRKSMLLPKGLRMKTYWAMGRVGLD